MTYIPKINVIKDDLINKEIDIFLRFLNHPQFPQNRKSILKSLSSLEKMVASGRDEKESVTDFLSSFYKKHQEKIDSTIKEAEENITKNSQTAVAELSKIMGYEWTEPVEYYAIPTILPFSPFNERERKFRFSILGKVFGKSNRDVLYIACHEISHFILFKLLKELPNPPSKELEHILKEAVAVVVLNQEPLKSMLGLENYKGNPEIQDIFIEKKNEVLVFSDYLLDVYRENKNFSIFLNKTIEELIPSSVFFAEKLELWNKNGKSIYDDSALLEQYRTPIKIRG